MNYTLTVESLDGVTSSWNELRHCLKWGSIFVLPAWLKVWWEVLFNERFQTGCQIRGFLTDFVSEIVLSVQLERETRFELATTCLEGRDSTN